MKKNWIALLFIIMLAFPTVTEAGSFGKGDDPSGNPGEWYVGTTPNVVAEEKYPILFVHGLNSSSRTWWDGNNMYNTATNNGYETAFIDLFPTKNMWDNGQLLAGKIQDMYRTFGEKIVVVAHSKGGIDTQSALVHYGASPYVERVITLSTPHYGSQLADLAYSNWAGWLVGILGGKNDATYSLQTGYMNYFRSQTDQHPNVNKVPIYTFGGTSWGSFGGSLYWGGLYLRNYGANDGAVTVNSSRLPYATELKVSAWDHSSIKEGSSTFNHFSPYLKESIASFAGAKSTNTSASILPQATLTATLPKLEDEQIGSIVRGGEYKGIKTESFFVEEGVKEITIDWMSDSEFTEVTVKDPNGKEYTYAKDEKEETGVFEGSYHHTITVSAPEAGKWRVTGKGNKKESYLLNISLNSPLNEEFSLELANGDVKVKQEDVNISYKTTVSLNFYKNGKERSKKLKPSKKNEGTYKLPNVGEGVYSMTIEMDGTVDGTPFQRTIVKSVYIDDKGEMY
ncbi:hypothetical protein Q75_11285 [Bacillus coahuilensis p1.1.43]|uniref:GPI inositol-deacylase PGAP1-like alpha/beta domain-containing protein n=1 Tax=Bacillus coahuilensis p1.1.43 TaxID=1150625 RepID=A0A147K6U6_9BACI|nr:hypothetical protein [Bacillus coahuilensis]KUP05761.1 hypothetical protein Q75_11285 [Bacillus coahuilensis p1.1.43]